MKTLACLVPLLLLFVITSACQKQTDKLAVGSFFVYRETSSKKCKVEEASIRPHFGEEFKGPYPKKDDAIKKMCEELDQSMTDITKCWDTDPINTCK